VRRKLIQFGTTFILQLCIWGHVSEIFDHWDNTFKTGYDIEYSTVIVVLIAGAVIIAFGHVAVALIRRVSATPCFMPLFASRPLTAGSLAALSLTPHPDLSESDLHPLHAGIALAIPFTLFDRAGYNPLICNSSKRLNSVSTS